MKVKISNTSLKKIASESNIGKKYHDSQVPGFYVKKNKSSITYFFRYSSEVTGKRETLKIGLFPELSADQAREIANSYAFRIRKGEDVKYTLQKKKVEQTNTIRNYMTEVYDHELSRKKDCVNIRNDIFNHLPEFLDIPMKSITHRQMLDWKLQKEKEGYSSTTIKKVYAYFKALLNHAVKQGGVLDANPIEHFKLELKPPTKEEIQALEKKRNALTDAQIKDFFKGLDLYQADIRRKNANSRAHGKSYLPDLSKVEYVDYLKPSMLVLFYTGLRPGDVLELCWSEVDFERKQLRKVINKTSRHKQEPTTIPLADLTLKVLQSWKNQQQGDINWVFPNPRTGKPFTKFYKQWNKVKSYGDLPESLHHYTLRHNFISHLVMNGANLLSIAKLAGTSVEMIEKYYGHLQPDLQSKFVNDFAKKFEHS